MCRTVNPELDIDHYLMTFQDGFQKTFHFAGPHGWVAIVANGRGAIDEGLYAEKFTAELPDKRLEITEYATRLLEHCQKLLKDHRAYGSIHSSGNQTNIAVAGFDVGDPVGKVVTITPETGHISPSVAATQNRISSGGESKFVNEAMQRYFHELRQELGKKQQNARRMGLELGSRDRLLLKGLSSRQPTMPFEQLIRFAGHAIQFTAKALVARNEFPVVGEEFDLITVTEKEGARFLMGENSFDDRLSYYETSKNYIMVKCCGQTSKFQIRVKEVAPPNAEFQPYPDSGYFKCSKCKRTVDLEGLVGTLFERED